MTCLKSKQSLTQMKRITYKHHAKNFLKSDKNAAAPAFFCEEVCNPGWPPWKD